MKSITAGSEKIHMTDWAVYPDRIMERHPILFLMLAQAGMAALMILAVGAVTVLGVLPFYLLFC